MERGGGGAIPKYLGRKRGIGRPPLRRFRQVSTSVLRIRIRDPVPFWPLDPGWVKITIWELRNNFLVKILQIFDEDPGWEKLGSGIRDEKIRIRDVYPGSATLATLASTVRSICIDMYSMFWPSFENFRAFFSSTISITKRDLREIRIFNLILDTFRVISQNYINLHGITLGSGISASREIVVREFRGYPRD